MRMQIDLSDSLIRKLQERAIEESKSPEQVLIDTVENGLAVSVAKNTGRFRLEDGSVAGQGVHPGIDPKNWEQIRALIYEGRGG